MCRNGTRSLVGDLCGLLSAMTYGLFTGWILLLVFQSFCCNRHLFNSFHMLHYHANNHLKSNLAAVLLKRLSGAEGERIDVQKLFGYIGLFTLVTLWWLGKDSLKDDFL